MKALSITQPFAWLISQGHKDIENRDWYTSYRGFLLIHAPQKVDSNFFPNGETLFRAYAEQVCGEAVAAIMPERIEDYIKVEGKTKSGVIVGYATLKEVVTKSASPWFRGKYGFVLTHRRPVGFISLRGERGLFDVPTEVEELINQIRDEYAMMEEAKDFNQIKREWREYRLEGDETPPWKREK